MNPLMRSINSLPKKSPTKPKTPAEVAAEMLKLQQQQAQNATMVTKPSSPTPTPAPTPTPKPSPQWSPKPAVGAMDENTSNPYYEQNQMLQGNYDVTAGPNPNQAPKPKPVNPLQSTASITTPVVAGYGINSLLGGSSSAGGIASQMVPASSAMTPIASATESALGIGAAAPAVNMSLVPSAAAPWWAAPGGSDAAALGSNIGSGLEYLGVGAESAGAIGSGLGTAIPVVGGLYGGYNLAQNLLDDKKDPMGGAMSGVATGAALGSFIPGVGTLVGGGLGALAGGALGMTGSGKGEDQVARDKVRAALQSAGMLDDKYNLTLADESKFDIGADGSIQNYNVDFEKEGVGDIVAAANPLAALVTGGDPKLKSDFAGYFTNAAMSSGESLENIKKFYADAGFDHAKAYAGINKLAEEGKLSREEADAYLNGLDSLFGVNAYAKGAEPVSEGRGSGGGSSKPKPAPAAPTPIVDPTPPTYGEPSGTEPVSLNDYVNAIVAVNTANQSEDPATQIMKLMKMKNPLYGSI